MGAGRLIPVSSMETSSATCGKTPNSSPNPSPLSVMDLSKLKEPFPAEDIEWRIGQAGESNGKVWATCLAYLTSRAVMDRLDEVCGPENWQDEYRPGPVGGVICGISIRVPLYKTFKGEQLEY